jgi:DNA anti-recombination protein RmuC
MAAKMAVCRIHGEMSKTTLGGGGASIANLEMNMCMASKMDGIRSVVQKNNDALKNISAKMDVYHEETMMQMSSSFDSLNGTVAAVASSILRKFEDNAKSSRQENARQLNEMAAKLSRASNCRSDKNFERIAGALTDMEGRLDQRLDNLYTNLNDDLAATGDRVIESLSTRLQDMESNFSTKLLEVARQVDESVKESERRLANDISDKIQKVAEDINEGVHHSMESIAAELEAAIGQDVDDLQAITASLAESIETNSETLSTQIAAVGESVAQELTEKQAASELRISSQLSEVSGALEAAIASSSGEEKQLLSALHAEVRRGNADVSAQIGRLEDAIRNW